MFCTNMDQPFELLKITPFENGQLQPLHLCEVEVFGQIINQEL